MRSETVSERGIFLEELVMRNEKRVTDMLLFFETPNRLRLQQKQP